MMFDIIPFLYAYELGLGEQLPVRVQRDPV